ncbi:hypothetical protein PSQ90_02200 [Devosia rhodophyticola]|uniref:DUF4383 domain-containing protein n=1 Tax=Devosia rhodophyticola TaxID=3026423 RepID=A0ABY7YYZ3_9HYPH|nr:DUF6789 family protein [Devosia rhodophyticola]WDR06298.1 hypothetical protein PSQ90_02200 [Devosia rhodophyticola]
MSVIYKGFVAGFVATVVLSALMVMKSMMGLMPGLDVTAMITNMLGLQSVAFGWLMHFIIGTMIWGGAYALIRARLPGGPAVSGMVFGAGAWLMMMILVMPMAGAGLFGLNMGIMAPVMTLILHLVYGAVLGLVFQAMAQGTNSTAAAH